MVNFSPAALAAKHLSQLTEHFKIYLAEESQLLVSQAKFASLHQHLTRLHQDIHQATARLEALEAKLALHTNKAY